MVKNLQSMLDEAKSRMVELTQVLTHLKDEYDPEAYYEKAAEKAMEPMLGHSSAAAAASNYGGAGGNFRGSAAHKGSDIPSNSQLT